MRKLIQLTALLLAMLFLLTSCNTVPTEPDSDTTVDTALTDSTTTVGSELPDEPNDTTTANDTTANEPEEPNEPEYDPTAAGTVVNVDDDALWYFINNANWDMANIKSRALAWFDFRYKDSGITDMLYNIEGSVPYAGEGEHLFDKLDFYEMKEENGVPVDYTQNSNILASYRIYTETDVDPYQVWFDRCRELGINPWLSFRMNDVHYANEPTGHTPFYYTAKQNGWFIGNSRFGYWANNWATDGSRYWYEYALNYEIPQVREHYLTMIDDRLSTYDVYGIELDWQRQIWSFPTDSLDNIKYINEFMEDVNELVEKYEKLYGHDIKIAVRINRDIDENMYFGFDTRYWGENGWADIIIPSCYFAITDSDMPISEWVRELGKYGIEIWAGLECDVLSANQYHNDATLAAYSAQYYSQGAKKIYLFNLFGVMRENYLICSSLENALTYKSRSYVVTSANCTPYGVKGITQWDPLPMKLEINDPQSIVISHGLLDYEKGGFVFVGFDNIDPDEINEDLIMLSYNGEECEFIGTSSKSYIGLSGIKGYGTVVVYKIPSDALEGSLKGELVFDPYLNATVTYVELMNGNLS